MYQNLQQLQNSPHYQNGYNQQYQRLMQMEQVHPQQTQYNMQPMMGQSQNFIKGRPVVSIEEARASQIDLDGSMYVFTDVGNKKIYTKQINLDGTASLNTYTLVDNITPTENYVTKTELDEIVSAIKADILILAEEGKKNDDKSTKTSTTTTTISPPAF